jgi:hypothetical protein
MTHPSWPSNTWQIYTSDYDTGAAYYAVKKACEPLHAQLNLPDFSLAVINTTRTEQRQLVLRSRVVSLHNRLLGERVDHLDASANAATTLAPLAELTQALAREGLVLLKLTLTDAGGVMLSENTYWQGRTPADQRRLNELRPQLVEMTAHGRESGPERVVTVRLKNPGSVPILNAKVTLLDETGKRVLPVYYSDNYIALLAGEERQLEIQCPAGGARCARVALRGWNVKPLEIAIGTAASATRQ